MPVASMCGNVAPMQSLMASMEVLQMVDRNTPKLIPANPGRGERIDGTFFSHDDQSLTLHQCQDHKPGHGSVAGDLEHPIHCYQSDARLNREQ